MAQLEAPSERGVDGGAWSASSVAAERCSDVPCGGRLWAAVSSVVVSGEWLSGLVRMVSRGICVGKFWFSRGGSGREIIRLMERLLGKGNLY